MMPFDEEDSLRSSFFLLFSSFAPRFFSAWSEAAQDKLVAFPQEANPSAEGAPFTIENPGRAANN